MNYNSNEQITVINNEFYYSFFDKFKKIHISNLVVTLSVI